MNALRLSARMAPRFARAAAAPKTSTFSEYEHGEGFCDRRFERENTFPRRGEASLLSAFSTRESADAFFFEKSVK